MSEGTTYFPNPFCIISFIYYFYVFYWAHVHFISLSSLEQLTMSWWEPAPLSKGSEEDEEDAVMGSPGKVLLACAFQISPN